MSILGIDATGFNLPSVLIAFAGAVLFGQTRSAVATTTSSVETRGQVEARRPW